MQRWIANLLLGWLVLLLPGAAALDLMQPQQLLPVCCRTHGAHHCALSAGARTAASAAQAPTGPAWKVPACPFTHLLDAAVLLPYLAAQRSRLLFTQQAARAATAAPLSPSWHAAGLPGQRGPPHSC